MTIGIREGYESLGLALGAALAQASRGKGAERHAEKGEPFSDQLIMTIPKRLGPGGECFCLGQALKKICESRRLSPDRARAELLGAINYIAAAWCLLGGVESVSAPEDAATPRFAEGGESVFAPEDRVMPLCAEGERVKYAVQGKWEPGVYVGVDPEGRHVVRDGSSFIHLDESLVTMA